MKYIWIDEYLMSLPAVTKDFKKEWNWIRYMIDDKMFTAICLDSNGDPHYITLKSEPPESEFLRKEYDDIIPGYYMNKTHWISINPNGIVPNELMKELLDKSYELVIHGFSKKKQHELLITAYCGLRCNACDWREPCHCNGCVSTKGYAFHCKNEPCPVAACVINKGIEFCGMCDEFPCKVLQDYSCDKEHGDNPPGARIETCRLICSILKK